MKILCINCKPDLTYFSHRGLPFDVEYKTIPLTPFPLQQLYTVPDSNGQMVTLYTPQVKDYLEANYKTFQYSAILVGWNPSDYGPEVLHTGGYTYPTPLSCGTWISTIRQDSLPNNIYPVHELHHVLCFIINVQFGDHVPKDFMDMTPIMENGKIVWKPYYENDPTITDPQSNFNQTWRNIIPFLPRLLVITYNNMPTVTITRNSDNGIETLGTLTTGTFICSTLERPWKNNAKNISCVPKGTYLVKWVTTPRFPNGVYQLQDVPGRTGIDMHSGNYFSDSDGCILLGVKPSDINHDGQIDVTSSVDTVNAFIAFMGKASFTLIIK